MLQCKFYDLSSYFIDLFLAVTGSVSFQIWKIIGIESGARNIYMLLHTCKRNQFIHQLCESSRDIAIYLLINRRRRKGNVQNICHHLYMWKSIYMNCTISCVYFVKCSQLKFNFFNFRLLCWSQNAKLI